MASFRIGSAAAAAVVLLWAAFGIPLAASQRGDQLTPEQQLKAGESRTSASGVYQLIMQEDCNLVLYHSSVSAIWASDTVKPVEEGRNCFFLMEKEGNAVIYHGENAASRVVFETRTGKLIRRNGKKDAPHYLEVQDDGNLVMYNDERRPVWATGTNGK